MIKRGDKFIVDGLIVEVKKALVDDNYIYITFDKLGFKKLPLRYFLKKFISLFSMVNVDYFIRKEQEKRKFKLTI